MDGPNGLRPGGALVLENDDSVSGQKSLRSFWNLSYLRKRWQTTKQMTHCMNGAKHNGDCRKKRLMWTHEKVHKRQK